MVPKITYRMWDDADEAGILALVRRNYGDYDTAHADYFDWEYRCNPLGRAIIGCGVTDDGTVATALATVPTPVRFRSQSLLACQLVNGMTDPDYRGQGLFSKCGRMVVEELGRRGIDLSYGFPNPTSLPSLTRKIGYSDIGRASLLVHLHDPAALAATRLPAARLFAGAGGRLLAKMVQKRPKPRMEVRLRDSFTGLALERLREDAELVVDTNIEWLNWRYVGVPRRPYKILIAGNDENPLAVAVYRLSIWENVRIGTINDLFLPPVHEPDAVESLLARILDESEASGCAATFCLATPSSRKEQILGRLGFPAIPHRFEPQPFSVILHGHSVSIDGITVSDMATSFGAYDVF